MISECLKQCSNYLIPWNKLLYFCMFSDSCSFEQPIFLYTAYNILDKNLAISNWKSFSTENEIYHL
jgi:hypothetical protein